MSAHAFSKAFPGKIAERGSCVYENMLAVLGIGLECGDSWRG
jgi:hypothetical protein